MASGGGFGITDPPEEENCQKENAQNILGCGARRIEQFQEMRSTKCCMRDQSHDSIEPMARILRLGMGNQIFQSPEVSASEKWVESKSRICKTPVDGG